MKKEKEQYKRALKSLREKIDQFKKIELKEEQPSILITYTITDEK
jgi:hypothetical protein